MDDAPHVHRLVTQTAVFGLVVSLAGGGVVIWALYSESSAALVPLVAGAAVALWAMRPGRFLEQVRCADLRPAGIVRSALDTGALAAASGGLFSLLMVSAGILLWVPGSFFLGGALVGFGVAHIRIARGLRHQEVECGEVVGTEQRWLLYSLAEPIRWKTRASGFPQSPPVVPLDD